MEEYCKKENIFFNENDRIKHQIKKSKGLYQEFKGSLQSLTLEGDLDLRQLLPLLPRGEPKQLAAMNS